MVYKIYVSEFGYIYDTSNVDLTSTMRVIDPKLSMEVNEPGTLEFKLTPEHPAYNAIILFKSTIDVVENDRIIWTGRCISSDQDMDKLKSFRCEGALAFFKDIVLPFKEYDSTTPGGFFEDIIRRYNALADSNRQFNPGGVNDNPDTEDFDPNTEIWRKTDYETTWEILEDMLLDAEGGYFELYKYSVGNSKIWIDYNEDFRTTCDQPIVIGTNLVSISNAVNGQNIVTDIVPICHYNDETYTLEGFDVGDDKRNKKYKNALNSNWKVRPNNSGVMINHNLRRTYPRVEKVVEYDMVKNLESVTSLEEKEDNGTITDSEKEQLAEKRASNKEIIMKTKYYMYKNAKKKAKQLEGAVVSITVNVADLANLRSGRDSAGNATHTSGVIYTSSAQSGASDVMINEGEPSYNFHLGDLVTVNAPSHGINNKQYPITQMTLDLTSGVKDLTIGVPEKRKLTKILKPNKNKAQSSYKKDSGKHTIRNKKEKKTPEEIGKLKFTQTHENPVSKKDEYYVGDELALGDYKVGLLLTDGSTRDVTESCTFTIGTGESAVPASGYEFQDRYTKMLYAHYTPEGSETELTCFTKITISDSYMRVLTFTQTKSTYKHGEAFSIDNYELQGRFDDNHTVNINLHDPYLSHNIANGHIMDKNTPNPLVAYYRGPETGPYGTLTAEAPYTFGEPGESGPVLNPGEANADGYRIRFHNWPRSKVWKKTKYQRDAFTLYPDGYNVHYELWLEKRDTQNGEFHDVCEITDLWNEADPPILTYTPSPGYFFKADGSDPTALDARYKTSSGTLRPLDLPPLNIEYTDTEDKDPNGDGYSIEFDLNRCPKNKTYGAGDRLHIQDYAVNLYYTDPSTGRKTLQSSDLIETEYYRRFPDLMWFKPANDYIFNGKPGKDPTELKVFFKSSTTGSPCSDTIPLLVDTKDAGEVEKNGYFIKFDTYPSNKKWDTHAREQFTLTPSGYTPYTVGLYHRSSPGGEASFVRDVTGDCRFEPEEGHAFHGDPADNYQYLWAFYTNGSDVLPASTQLHYIIRQNAPGETNDRGWSIRFTQDTSKVWQAGDTFRPDPLGNYTPYEAHLYYTDKETGVKSDQGPVISTKIYERNPEICYFYPPIGYRFKADGTDPEKLTIYYKDSSTGQQISHEIKLKIEEDTLEDKEKNTSDYSIEFVKSPQGKVYQPGEDLLINTPSGVHIYEVHLFVTDRQTQVKSDQGDITNFYMRSTGEMWYSPAPGYTFTGKGDPARLYAYYTGAGSRVKDSVPLSVESNTLGAKDPDADGWSVEFVSYPADKEWIPGDQFSLTPEGFTPYRAHLFYTAPGSTQKIDQGDITFLYKNNATQDWYNLIEGTVFNGRTDPSTLEVYHKTNKGVVWDSVPLNVQRMAPSATGLGPKETDQDGYFIEFTRTKADSWATGQTFSLNEYEVTLKGPNGFNTVVTNSCTYNIGYEGQIVGGIKLEQDDYTAAGANRHVINGHEPATLKATYVRNGVELWDETPLRVNEAGFHARADCLVYAAGTILSENNGNRTPYKKANDGWAAVLLGYNASGNGWGGNWFVVVVISTDPNAVTLSGTPDMHGSYVRNGKTFYVTVSGTNRAYGGSTTYTNPLGLPYTQDVELHSVNIMPTDEQFDMICQILEIY